MNGESFNQSNGSFDRGRFNKILSGMYDCIILFVEKIAFGHDNAIRIWKVDSDDCFKILNGHKNKKVCKVYDDGIMSGSLHKTIKLWNVNSGICLRTF